MNRFQYSFICFILIFLCVNIPIAAQAEIDEQTAFDAANQNPNPFERVTALSNFVKKFPRSALKMKAGETIVEIHAQLGEFNLRNNDLNSGLEQFQLAVAVFSAPMSDETFSNIVVKIPFNLYFRNQTQAAADRAREIETKINANAPRLLKLSEFYLAIENAAEAKRLAERALAITPNDANAYQILGLANRINFRLEAASQAYSRALALDSSSITAKRNLADTLRGLGQTEDAIKLYRELLETNANDEAAHNGYTLALFDANRKTEAEQELNAALTQNPKNLSLLSGAAYWYAANGNGERAVELANRAIAIEPRYVWASIALSRGLLLEKKPLEAERALLIIQQYANFPTLNYELASVHAAAGLYAEANDDLKRSFALKNGTLTTNLANRTKAEASNFEELLARERRASIFQPVSASDKNEILKLKQLFVLSKAIEDNANEKIITKAAQDFANDTNDANDSTDKDEMRVYRQLFAANRLLEKRIALPQIIELTDAATNGLENSLDVASPSAAVLGEELYEPRRVAKIGKKIVNVPDVPRSTLSKVMRGRVEEIVGWTLYQQNDLNEAAVHLKRAIDILPANSAWWRSSNWKLGSVLEASGNSNEALNAYIKSYKSDVPNPINFAVIKSLYQKLNNGSLDGLEAKMEIVAPDATSQASLLGKADRQTNTNTKSRNPLPQIVGQIIPKTETPKPIATPQPTPEIKSEIVAVVKQPTPEPTPQPTPEPTIESTPQPTPEITVETTPQPTPEIKAVPTPEVIVEAAPQPTPEIQAETTPQPTSQIIVEEKSVPAASKTEIEVDQNAVAVTETKPQTATNTANSDSTTNEKNSRPRVVIVDISKQVEPINTKTNVIENVRIESPQIIKTNTPANVPCAMWFSQNPLSVLRNGGRTSLLVVLENAQNTNDLTMSINAPDDVTVVPVEDVVQDGNRRLYEVRSTSERTGEFIISFDSPCGKQNVKVRVR